ncbi:MAG: S1C family serine protease [Anaerolineae bacterium]|nr:S1C family serine protease [Anaerolineae bacterium]
MYDTDGHIITNYHVVQGADKIVVSFYDGTLARAEVVAEDPGVRHRRAGRWRSILKCCSR